MIKVSDYIAEFVAKLGIKHVFAITGGASIHMIHSIAERDDIDFICPHHEQAGAMAADVYSRVSGNIGCALATSGPGATNMITGIAGAWFDSVPVLYLTGQVARFRFKGDTGVRQMGFQETDIVSMVASITKYVAQIMKAEDLRYELEKAVYIAKSGRPGPVLVDIPDDLQREMIDPSTLRGFTPKTVVQNSGPSAGVITQVLDMIKAAKRPVIVLGFGVRLSGAQETALKLIERLGIPVCPSWAAADMIPGSHPLLAGTFGTHGSRTGNFAVQNADLVLSIGARLSTRETGNPLSSWAREARCIIVDIDPAELTKFPAFDKQIDLPIQADARLFIEAMLNAVTDKDVPDTSDWLAHIIGWRAKYPACLPKYKDEIDTNPYVFVQSLAASLQEDDVIVVDTGCAVAWMMQGFEFKPGQRLIHAFNNTPMGFGLPGAIGAALALGGKKRVICVAGDGSMMMNLQELATVQHHDLPIKLFLINNAGYSMVQQTQEQWLGGKHFATSATKEGGLSFPDFGAVATSFGIDTTTIKNNSEIDREINRTLQLPGAVLCDVYLPASSRVMPQSRFGFPIEDSEPLLPREEFLANMLVKPMPASLDVPKELLLDS
ncbi:MAG: thiamine pyrophosphate-binding protein [Rhodospirillaceae bacterium]